MFLEANKDLPATIISEVAGRSCEEQRDAAIHDFPFVIARSSATRQSTTSLFCHCEEQRDAAIQPNRNFVIPHFAADWIAASALRASSQ